MLNILFIFLILAFLIISISLIVKKQTKKEKLAHIKSAWGHSKVSYRDFKLIATYLDAYRDDSNLSPSVAGDLDLDDIFEFIDHTNSKPGQQLLYKKLHSTSASDKDFLSLEQRIERINRNKELREYTQLMLSKLNSNDAYYLPDLFRNKHAPLFRPFVKFYIIASPLLIVIILFCLGAIPLQLSLLLILLWLITNAFIHYRNKTKMLSYIHSLPQVRILIDVAQWLEKKKLLDDNDTLKQSLINVSKLKTSLNFINLQNKLAKDPTDVIYLISEWFKLLLLVEPIIFIFSLNRVNKYLNEIKIIYDSVANVDVAISIQSVRDGAMINYCKPEFSQENKNIIINDLYHPLVENCVLNSISVSNNKGVLITGSNMSGKTTFMRAIAVNVLLSQTINTCFASKYVAPRLEIFTSINRNDDLGNQRSYFEAEASSIKSILDNCVASESTDSIVIIDEIFRGTNTIERIASAKAILSYFIEHKVFAFVSTHDLELAELLGVDYQVFSFEQLNGNGELIFDYKIKKGVLKNKNAITILKNLDFPEKIINEASQITMQLRSKI